MLYFSGPGNGSQQSDPENGGEVPTTHYNYVAFGQGISDKVKKAIMNEFHADEYKLNGRSVEERFGEGSERVLCVTTPREYSESPSGDASSSLTAQMRQLQATKPDDRVHVVQIPDQTLREVEGAQDTDGVSPVVSFVNDRIRQQPSNWAFLQRQNSNMNKVFTTLQSIHRMIFSKCMTSYTPILIEITVFVCMKLISSSSHTDTRAESNARAASFNERVISEEDNSTHAHSNGDL